MSNLNEFEWMQKGESSRSAACPEWAEVLPDAADGLLDEVAQEALDRHLLTCSDCSAELAEAQHGAAWLAMLKGHAPEPPASLLQSILSKTSEAERMVVPEAAKLAAQPARAVGYSFVDNSVMGPRAAIQLPASPDGLWRRLEAWLGLGSGFGLQPRLAMTSAMAFFSVCVTLNLLGVSVRDLKAESLRPAGLQRTVADTSASLVRSFEGIRMVYRVESRVNEWRTASAAGNDPHLATSR